MAEDLTSAAYVLWGCSDLLLVDACSELRTAVETVYCMSGVDLSDRCVVAYDHDCTWECTVVAALGPVDANWWAWELGGPASLNLLCDEW